MSDEKPCFYIGFCGFDSEGRIIGKYGETVNIYRRVYKEHKNDMLDFEIIYVVECANPIKVEQLFKKTVKSLELDTTFKGIKYPRILFYGYRRI